MQNNNDNLLWLFSKGYWNNKYKCFCHYNTLTRFSMGCSILNLHPSFVQIQNPLNMKRLTPHFLQSKHILIRFNFHQEMLICKKHNFFVDIVRIVHEIICPQINTMIPEILAPGNKRFYRNYLLTWWGFDRSGWEFHSTVLGVLMCWLSYNTGLPR